MISLKREILKKPKIKIYSKLEDDKIKYIISLDSNEKAKKHRERIVLATFKEGNPRWLKKQVAELLRIASEDVVDKRVIGFSIKQIKKNTDIELTNEMTEILSVCTDKEKRDLEEITVKREVRIEEIIPDISIDYENVDKLVPSKDAIDLSSVSNETIKEVGQEVQERVDELNSIKSEEDARLYKDSLEAFMTHEEIDTDREKILLSFIEKIDKLDTETIIETLKVIEDKDIKYSKLYPIYLRIQEKRIMKKVQMYLIGLKSTEKFPDGQIEKFLEILEQQKIEDIEGNDLNSVMAGFIGNENNELEQYIKNDRKVDIDMVKYIRMAEVEEEKLPEKEEILTYLENRIASLRQVGKSFEKFELRTYIEDTGFKDADETEQNIFLYNVAEMEKQHLIAKYGDILDRYNEKGQKTSISLGEYNTQLTEKQREKQELQELYEGYNKLLNDRNKSKEKDGEGRNGE